MSRKYKMHDESGIYFITFAVVGWVDVFTRELYGDIFVQSLAYCQQEKGLELFAWVLMSIHVHLIAKAKAGHKLPDILRDFKKYTSKQIVRSIEANKWESRREWMLPIFRNAGSVNSNNKVHQFWQQNNHPIILYSNSVKDQKLHYLHNNPVKAGIVDDPEDYIYSSARNYAGRNGLINVHFL
jgi:putative transposase